MRWILAAALSLALVGCGSSKAPPQSAQKPTVGSTALTIRAALASSPQLFAIFPRLPGVRSCAVPLIEGLRESALRGTCRTSVGHPVTHGRYREAFVTFREDWGRQHHSSWTLIVQLPAGKVVATQLHGEPSPQMRFAATDGVAQVAAALPVRR